MIILKKGTVVKGKLVTETEDIFVQSEKARLVKKFMNLKLNKNESAVLINKKSGGMIRKGQFFDLNTIQTIV